MPVSDPDVSRPRLIRDATFLEGVLEVDLDALDIELPRGFGRD